MLFGSTGLGNKMSIRTESVDRNVIQVERAASNAKRDAQATPFFMNPSSSMQMAALTMIAVFLLVLTTLRLAAALSSLALGSLGGVGESWESLLVARKTNLVLLYVIRCTYSASSLFLLLIK